MGNFLGTILLFGGYTLVYAATAKGGVFATEPWNGLMTDAYTGMSGGALTESQVAQAQQHPLSKTPSFARPRNPAPLTPQPLVGQPTASWTGQLPGFTG